jgi:hypothetical protein
MSAKKINAALVAAYRAAMPGLINATAYEGAAFTPTVGSKWAQLTNLRAGDDPATLGIGGQDEASGVFQIDISVAENTGTAALLTDADTLKAYFVGGRTFTYESQCVHVRKADVSQIRRVDGWLRISVSVFYLSRSTRGSF